MLVSWWCLPRLLPASLHNEPTLAKALRASRISRSRAPLSICVIEAAVVDIHNGVACLVKDAGVLRCHGYGGARVTVARAHLRFLAPLCGCACVLGGEGGSTAQLPYDGLALVSLVDCVCRPVLLGLRLSMRSVARQRATSLAFSPVI